MMTSGNARTAGFTGALWVLSAACASVPVHTSLPVEVRASPNFGDRKPNYVVVHHTTKDSAERALVTLTSLEKQVSSHYLIARDGRIICLVDEWKRAWHAGQSYWAGNRDLNSSSIGIELDNDGVAPFTDPQLESLLALLGDLVERWGIPPQNVLGHADIAPGRKVDPSALFPWKRLAEAGFGLWCDPPFEPAPAGLDDALLLAALGYDLSEPAAAVAAFKRHWAPEDLSPALSPEQRGLVLCLLRKRHETPAAVE